MPRVSGEKLGPYELVSPLGAGGMGEVYRARDPRMARDVAIKICSEHFSDRFEREVHAVAALNHPNICQIYDVGPNYLVMELVDGSPLEGPLPLAKALRYAGQILDALDAAHRKGITHRDLKPANILVTRDGIKLLDFGLAKHSAPLGQADATLTAALTQHGQILGTLQYMSPEQLRGSQVDTRSDLFSFGCVFYEMLSGKQAFEGNNAASLIAAILEREPAPLEILPTLKRVIQTCLAKDPDHRFQNALDLKRALTWSVEQAVPILANRRAPWLALGATMLVIGALTGWALSHLREPLNADRVLRLHIDPPPGGRFLLGGTSGDRAISPDGKIAALVASVNGKTGLWVRPLDSSAIRLLPGTEGAGQPFWSPDSRSIAFVALGTSLRRVYADAGTPAEICDPGYSLGVGSWGDDGNILFTGLISGRSGVFRVAASGGTPSLITAPDASRGEIAYRWPQALPDGRFLYVAEGSQPEASRVYAASLAKPGERVELLSRTTRAVYTTGLDGRGYLLFVRGGAVLAQEFNSHKLKFDGEPHVIAEAPSGTAESDVHVAVSANGLLLYGAFGDVKQLAWFDRAGKSLGRLGPNLESVAMFRLSHDERNIAIQRRSGGTYDLWLLDAERGVINRFTADAATSTQAVWSPDASVILFTHLGSHDLLRKPANGVGDEELVMQRPNEIFPTDWSGDSRWLLMDERSPETKLKIWKLPLTPDGHVQRGAAPEPYLRTRFNEWFGRFSPEPNPHWVAYASDESGQYEIYIDAFPEPRGKKRISTAGGAYPKWGVGGRELFYVSPDNKLMAVSLKLGKETVEPSTPRELFPLPLRGPAGPTYQLSRDGQRFVVLTNPEQGPQSLNLIVNWPALLQ